MRDLAGHMRFVFRRRLFPRFHMSKDVRSAPSDGDASLLQGPPPTDYLGHYTYQAGPFLPIYHCCKKPNARHSESESMDVGFAPKDRAGTKSIPHLRSNSPNGPLAMDLKFRIYRSSVSLMFFTITSSPSIPFRRHQLTVTKQMVQACA